MRPVQFNFTSSSLDPQHRAASGSPIAVRGLAPPPGLPCVVLISTGSSSDRGRQFEDRLRLQALRRGYHSRAISVRSNRPEEVIPTLSEHIPEHAYVVLFNTDAPVDLVERLLAALPSQTILPEGQAVGPYDADVSTLLDRLPDVLRTEASLPDVPNEAATPWNAYPTPASMHWGALTQLPPRQHYEALMTSMYDFQNRTRDLDRQSSMPGGSASSVHLPGAPFGAIPVTAPNPTESLSQALDLDLASWASGPWQNLATTYDLSSLAALVAKVLKDTHNPNLKPMLRHLVEQMVAKPSLAKRVFGVLQGAGASCVDRASLAWHRAELELLVQPVWNGELDDDLSQVLKIGRQAFCRSCIDRLADVKVQAINEERRAQGLPPHEEEIETHLHYISELHERLDLGGQKPDAQYLSLSRVMPEDIDSAMHTVLAEQATQFDGFFATWHPWQEVVRRLFPDQVAHIEATLIDTDHLEQVHREVTEATDRTGLPDGRERDEAITTGINQRSREESKKLWRELTAKVLNELD